MAKRTSRSISLDHGGPEPLVLAPRQGSLIAECRGPEGVAGAAAADMVTAAIASAEHGPPLASQVVPGDHVAIAVAGDVPQAESVIKAVRQGLETAGVEADDTAMIHGAPEKDADTAYLAADEAGNPLYLARSLIDADVVVAIGSWTWDASLGGRALDGELWPRFSRPEARQDLVRQLAKRGRQALADWRAAVQGIAWQLGVCASLRVMAGRDGTLAAAVFGLPEAASDGARVAAAEWSPVVPRPAALTIASVGSPLEPWADGGLAAATRAVAAAARVTQPDGTICLAGRLAFEPGVVFSRWRQGAPLHGLVHEALATKDPRLEADALQARLFARALDERRLVLLSDLDAATVEELEFGHAESAADVERLAARAESLIVLHEADRMLPRLAP